MTTDEERDEEFRNQMVALFFNQLIAQQLHATENSTTSAFLLDFAKRQVDILASERSLEGRHRDQIWMQDEGAPMEHAVKIFRRWSDGIFRL